jgi:hypothetical protein
MLKTSNQYLPLDAVEKEIFCALLTHPSTAFTSRQLTYWLEAVKNPVGEEKCGKILERLSARLSKVKGGPELRKNAGGWSLICG